MERHVVAATPRSSWSTRLGSVLTLALLVTMAAATSSAALAPRAPRAPSTNVSTDPAGAHVRLARSGVWIEIRGPRRGGSSGGGSTTTTGCLRRWVPTRYPARLRDGIVSPDLHVAPAPTRPGPEYLGYYVYCGATYVDSVWLPPNAFAPAASAADIRALAEQLARDLPYPVATIRINPDGRGLTGLESWFWVTGYSGVLRDAVDGLGVRVEVEARPGSVQWSFGDGTPTRAGTLGRATPARSDVAHTYERRSASGPLPIRATVRLDVRYRVDNGPWQALDPVLRTAARGYPVAESRAALVPPS